MLCLSLYQPWASFVAYGIKTVETRSWGFAYRGPLLIHAGKRPLDRIAQAVAARTLGNPSALDRLRAAGSNPAAPWPLGAVVGAAQVVHVWRTEGVGVDPAATWGGWRTDDTNDPTAKAVYVTALEASLGDYSPKRFAIALDRCTPLPAPVPARGFQGLFTVPDDLIPAAVREVVTRPGRSWRSWR